MSKNIYKFLKLLIKIKNFRIKYLILFCILIIPGGSEIYKKFKKSW